jgi:hypothetical protein
MNSDIDTPKFTADELESFRKLMNERRDRLILSIGAVYEKCV